MLNIIIINVMQLYYKPIPYDIKREALSFVMKFLKTYFYFWIPVYNIMCNRRNKGKIEKADYYLPNISMDLYYNICYPQIP